MIKIFIKALLSTLFVGAIGTIIILMLTGVFDVGVLLSVGVLTLVIGAIAGILDIKKAHRDTAISQMDTKKNKLS